jgi:hypothetical protein
MKDKITKISEIKKVIDCPCGRGTMELRGIHVIPQNGIVWLSYSACSEPFCGHGRIKEGHLVGVSRGISVITDIIIPELILGE